MTYTALVPLPSRDLSPNGSRGHWTKTSRARRAYREYCEAIFAMTAPRVPFEVCTVKRTMRICRKALRESRPGMRSWLRPGVPLSAVDSYRPTDSDNASAALKPLLDALQDAGVIKTDRASHCRVETVEFEYVETHALEGVFVEVGPRVIDMDSVVGIVERA